MSIKVSFGTLEDIQPMIDLDLDIYPVEGLVTKESVIDRLNKDKYQYLVAKDESNRLMGYLNIVSMTDYAFNRVLEGSWIESEELIVENILTLVPNTQINCYITSINARDNNSEVAAQLLFGIIKYVRLLAHKKIRIKNMAGISFSKEGKTLCEKLGFTPVKSLERLNCGLIPCVYLLDLSKENASFLIKKIRRITNSI